MSLLLKKLSNCLLYNFSYKHALDGVLRVAKEEGILKLFNGAQWASSRAVMVTVGQLCFYDVIKAYLLTTPYFKDNLTTHFTSSLGAVRILYVLTSWNVSWEIHYALCIVFGGKIASGKSLMASNCFATNHLFLQKESRLTQLR